MRATRVADLGDLRRQAAVATFDGRAAPRPRHDADQRQCARRTSGEIGARSEDSAVAVVAGARVDRRGRRGARRHRRTRRPQHSRPCAGAASCSPAAASRTMSRGARRCFRTLRPAPSTSRLGRSATPATDCGSRKPPAAASKTACRMPPPGCRCRSRARKDGSRGVMPHFIDRAKPGVIAVTRDGKRFANEGNSYHDFVQAMMKAAKPGRGDRGLPDLRPQDLAQIRPRLRAAVSDAARPSSAHRLSHARRRRSPHSQRRPGSTRRGSRRRSRSSMRRQPRDAIPLSARARAPTTAIRAMRCTGRTPASRRSKAGRSTRSRW